MKILLVSDAFLPSFGGVERHVYTLAKYLANKGNEVTILTEKSKYDDIKLELNGIEVRRNINLLHRKSALQWVYQYLQNSYRIKEAINENSQKFDLVHYHGTHTLYFDKIGIKSPLLATIHGIFPACISFWGINEWCENKPSAINCANCMVKIRKYYAPFYPGMVLYNKYYLNRMKNSLGSIDKIISVSNYVKDIVQNSLDLDNIITIYNFINKNEIINEIKSIEIEPEINNNIRNVMYSGRLHNQKGIQVLLKSFIELQNEVNDVHLIITGKGELEELVISESKERVVPVDIASLLKRYQRRGTTNLLATRT